MSVMSINGGRNDLEPGEIRAALARVTASRRLRACPRLASFLRFIVEATLAGRGERIKGYTIGVEALGRPESFDPQSDPIVRVEASRLRRLLADYYAGEGAADPVAIELPRGRYVPVFKRRVDSPPRWLHAARSLGRLLHRRLVLEAPADRR